MPRFRLALSAIIALLLVALPALAAPTHAELQQKVEDARKGAGLVALGAVIANADGEILGLAVAGERRKGSHDAVQPEDSWHLGSNTKMLTALLYGRLVEQGDAKWGATLPELFPDLADGMDPSWNDVTIEHLLSHRSGLAPNPGPLWFLTARGSKSDMKTQRTALAKGFLSKPPGGTTGEYVYSNLGYMIAGAALDRIAARLGEEDYEALFLSSLVPAGEGWGFGPPPEGIEGHAKGMFGLKAQGSGLQADNPPAVAPAGTLNAPLAAHARFLASFLTPDATQAKLLTPFPDETSAYALGWAVDTAPSFGKVYAHNGSNTIWLSTVRLYPELDLVVIVNTNIYSDEAVKAVAALSLQLIQMYEEKSLLAQ